MVKNLSANAGDTSDVFDLRVTKVPRSRKWQPTPVGWKIPQTGMPGGQRSPWCDKVWMQLSTQAHTHVEDLINYPKFPILI